MPSQQINLPNFSNSDIPRSLAGPNILHKHSINSLLEQHDLIARVLSSPTEGDTMSIPDLLGFGNNTTTTTNVFAANQQPHHHIPSNSPTLPYSPLTPNSTLSSISSGAYSIPSPKNFDTFQFDNIGQNTPLKMFQRNLSYDCSTPISPSTPSSLYPQSFKESPKFRDSNSPISNNDNSFGYQLSSGSNSPDSDYNALLPNVDNNLIDLMNFLSINQNAQTSPYQQLQVGNIANDLQNLQTLTALKFLQQQHQQTQQLQQQQQQQQQNQHQHQQQQTSYQKPSLLGINQIIQNCNQNPINTSWHQTQQQQQHSNQITNHHHQHRHQHGGNNDSNLDRMARFHRSSAAISDTTSTWSGVLPQRSTYNKVLNYSNKVFIGGIPPDINEDMFIDIFKPFGQVRVEWPGKESQPVKPKGYIYIIFESEKQVKSLLASCLTQEGNATTSRKYFYKISSKCLKTQKVEVIPWIISDSNYVKSSSQKLDPTKTVFVGALHGQLTAEGLAKIMDDLFGGVVYAGIDTDKHKYPLGSARVTFNNCHSYFKAVTTAYIDVRTSKFKRKVFQVDPYLEDSLCSSCGVQHGPYFCKELYCYRYFCQSCWQTQHSTDPTFRSHTPMSRNSKSQHLVGIGPMLQLTGTPTGSPPLLATIGGNGSICGGSANGSMTPSVGTPTTPTSIYNNFPQSPLSAIV